MSFADESENWWKEPVVEYAFNLPSVGAYLDKQVGTNVVRMTDYTFMMELRQRIWVDFDTKIIERIQKRRNLEIEREKHLILKGSYNQYNRPEKLIPLHSTVLAFDLSDTENSVMKKNVREQTKQYESPVFNINERTNKIIRNRRLKLKSTRQKNVEYYIECKWKLEPKFEPKLEPNLEPSGNDKDINQDELGTAENEVKDVVDGNEMVDIEIKRSVRFDDN